MRQVEPKILKTSFGTNLKKINGNDGLFIVNKNVTVTLDTPLIDYTGTKKTFLKDAVVAGTLWQEINQKVKKTRKVVMVDDENGRYLISASNLEPTSRAEVEAKQQIADLKGSVEELKNSTSQDTTLPVQEKGLLEREYVGFTGKQILFATLGIIILIKVFK